MKHAMTAVFLAISSLFTGCAGLDFGEEGLAYFEPQPYLFVSTNKDCVSTATIISIPGEKRSVRFRRGYGSADLSIALSNGIITNAGQKTDLKIPETITSMANLGTAMATISADKSTKQVVCMPSAALYPIKNGMPDLASPSEFPVESKVINAGIDK